METIKRFEDLDIWKEARRLAKEIHLIVQESDLKSDFRFRDQIKAASGSVMDNIAEGLKEMETWSSDSFYQFRKDRQVKSDLIYTEFMILAI